MPYRAVGLVCDPIPFSVAQLGVETFVTTAVGRAFHVFAETKLRLAFTGPQLPRAVTALATSGELTAAACGTAVHVYNRAELVATLQGEHAAPVRHLLMLSETTLLSVCEGGTLIAWSLPEGDVVRRLHAGFTPTSLCHPATYLNKVLLGASDGRLQLHNVRSGQKVHEFAGWGSAVLCLEQSPALDVVGIGHADGRIVLHNLRVDRSVLTLSHEEGDACSSLAFRTDGVSVLVSAGGTSGALHVWHLEKRTRLTSIPDAHHNGVLSTYFVRGQPLLISMGSSDNSLKVWTFDRPDGGARVLRSRSGHSAAPTAVRFHADALISGGFAAGQAYLLSGGADRMIRQSSIWTSQQDNEYSQKREEGKASMHVSSAIEKRLPPLLDLASSEARERDWANVITCHVGCKLAYTWETTRKALGQHTLSLTRPSNVSAVAISSCGNFGYLGGESGVIEKFNLQSGLRRASTEKKSDKKKVGSSSSGENGHGVGTHHKGAVRGLATDALGREIYSGGADASLIVWRTSDLTSLQTLDAVAPIALLRRQRDGALAACACDDVSIRVFDVTVGNGRLVRHLTGHSNRITDVAWSSDGRWLLSTGLDSTIRIVDVPSGSTIGRYKVDDPPTSIAVSPQGEFIATSHAGSTAICVWANRAFFQSALINPVGEGMEAVKLEMPIATGAGEEEEDDDDEDGEEENEEAEVAEEEEESEEEEEDEEEVASKRALSENKSREQLGGCITLSHLPPSHSRTLIHLDTIQQRNLPVKPPTAPKQAPFFLPSVPKSEAGAGGVREFVAGPQEEVGGGDGGSAAAAEAALNGGGGGGEDEEDDEWAAAAAAAGFNDDDEMMEEEEGGGEPEAKRPKKGVSRVVSSHGASHLSTLQQLLKSAGDVAVESGWVDEDEAAAADADSAGSTTTAMMVAGDQAASTTSEAAAVSSAYESVLEHLLTLSPSALDLEIRSLGTVGVVRGGGAEEAAADELRSMLHFFASQLIAGKAFELLQASLCVFLRVHQQALTSTPQLRGALLRLQRSQEGSWGTLRKELHTSLCLLSHLCRT